MRGKYLKAEIKENSKLCNGIYKLVVKHDHEVRAGQFYMLKPKSALLGRPISVCEVNGIEVSFLYAMVGVGTNEFMKLKPGEDIDIIGPLGNGFDTTKDYGKVVLVGGGIGIAPMLQLAKELKLKAPSINMDLIGGFRDEPYLVDEIGKYVDEVFITTNSGGFGTKGFVTDVLDLEKYDTVFCCGPEIMMKNVVEMCKKKGTRVYVSMEKHMACGVGACLVCTCKTKDGNKRTCKDGPVFDGYKIEF